MNKHFQSAINEHMGKSIEQLCLENQKESAELIQILAVDTLRYLRVTSMPASEDTSEFYYSKTQHTLLVAILDGITTSSLVSELRKKQANYLYSSIICRMTFLETINAIRLSSELAEAAEQKKHEGALKDAEGYLGQS
jgi:hypothetical protein